MRSDKYLPLYTPENPGSRQSRRLHLVEMMQNDLRNDEEKQVLDTECGLIPVRVWSRDELSNYVLSEQDQPCEPVCVWEHIALEVPRNGPKSNPGDQARQGEEHRGAYNHP